MSEYWVSRNKYWCKYCDTYIADDAPSRRRHENGLRHQGNRDRFVRGLYKEGERKKKDLADEKREMARVELAANAAFAKDVHSGLASASTSRQASAPAPAAQKPAKPASKWSNYSTAQSLGYIDPDEERMKAELERRRTQGIVGAWEVVAPPPPPLDDAKANESAVEEEGLDSASNDSSIAPQKREAEEDPEDIRGFKFRKRMVRAGLDELWDPGSIPIKLKSSALFDNEKSDIKPPLTNEEDKIGTVSESNVPTAKQEPSTETTSGEKPPRQPGGWKRATVSVVPSSPPVPLSFEPLESGPGASERNTTVNDDPEAVKQEDAKPSMNPENIVEPGAGGMFRKRKVPAGNRGSGGRR